MFLARAQHRSIPTTHEHPWGDRIIPLERRRLVTKIIYKNQKKRGGLLGPKVARINAINSLQQQLMVVFHPQLQGESHQLQERSQVRGTQAVCKDGINNSLITEN